MTSFSDLEQSLDSGRPVRLYQFTRGPQSWYYSSADRDITHLTQTYKALTGGMVDDGIKQTGETTTDNLTLTAPADLEVAQLYRGAAPSDTIDLTVYDRHYGIDDYLVVWTGEITAVSWPSVDRCSITCSPLSQRLTTDGLRLGWTRNCPYALYSTPCGVESTAYRVDSSIQEMDGAAISNGAFEAYEDGYFTAGYIEWSAGSGNWDRRAIESHSGSSLTLLGGTSGLTLNQAIRVYPGCGQTVAACKGFNNLPNYGGIPQMSGTSPYDNNNYF